MEERFVDRDSYHDHVGGQRQQGGHYYYDADHNPLSGYVHPHGPQQHVPQPNSGASGPAHSPYAMYAKPPLEDIHGPRPQAQGKRPNPIMMQFYDENGQVDLPKMLSTVNQLASTFQQVTPVIQQIGSLVRLMR